MSRMTWPPDDDAKLRALAASGLSVAQIAEQMVRSRNTVRARARKLGIVVARDLNAKQKVKFALARRNRM